MPATPTGIHHVTAVASDPQRNADFYREVLGLRLVKTTVNFDAPDTYHLYYGDESGSPGSLITFFPWPGAPRGRLGTGQVTTTSFSVPEGSLGWWRERLSWRDIDIAWVGERADESALAFRDPDGLLIELAAHSGTADPRAPWEHGPVPPEHAVRGLYSVTMTEADDGATVDLLTDTLGFRLLDEQPDRIRCAVASGGPGEVVDVLRRPRDQRGLVAAGTVHHIAWRTSDDGEQLAWRQELTEQGVEVTPIRDRQYFRSIYFREPGGVLLEIATDQPGFTADEPLLELGRHLKLPPWLEPDREQIRQALPELKLPDFDTAPTEAPGGQPDERG